MNLERILVVDDEPLILSIISRFLKRQGYEVDTVGSGAAALARLRETPFALVLSDLKMPHMDGLQVLQEVKEHYPDTEFVMMTAFATIDATISALRKGVYDFLTKPLDLNQLVSTVQRALEHRALTLQNRELMTSLREKNRILAYLHRAEQLKSERLRQINAIASQITPILDADKVIDAVVEQACQVFHFASLSFALIEQERIVFKGAWTAPVRLPASASRETPPVGWSEEVQQSTFWQLTKGGRKPFVRFGQEKEATKVATTKELKATKVATTKELKATKVATTKESTEETDAHAGEAPYDLIFPLQAGHKTVGFWVANWPGEHVRTEATPGEGDTLWRGSDGDDGLPCGEASTSDEILSYLESLAAQTVVVLENARLYALARRADELAFLNRVGEAANQSLDLQETVQSVLACVANGDSPFGENGTQISTDAGNLRLHDGHELADPSRSVPIRGHPRSISPAAPYQNRASLVEIWLFAEPLFAEPSPAAGQEPAPIRGWSTAREPGQARASTPPATTPVRSGPLREEGDRRRIRDDLRGGGAPAHDQVFRMRGGTFEQDAAPILGSAFAGRVGASPLLLLDQAEIEACCGAQARANGQPLRSLLGVPLHFGEQQIGILSVGSTAPDAYSLEDGHLLTITGRHIATAIENARLFQEIELQRRKVLESRNTLLSIFDSILDGIYFVNRAGKILAINRTQANRAGYTFAELVGQPAELALPGPSIANQRVMACIEETFQSGKPLACRERQQVDGERPDAFIEWSIHTYPVTAEPGERTLTQSRRDGEGGKTGRRGVALEPEVDHVVIVVRDVTEQRQLEASLIQSEKMAAVGHLAAGIAHEINNPLTVISANVQILREELPPSHPYYESVELIYRAQERASQVVQNLLNFSRPEAFEFMPTDLNLSLLDTIALIEPQMRKANIQVLAELASDLPLISASPHHLRIVWLNLLLNARDALQSVQESPDARGPKWIKVASGRRGDAAFVRIADNGVGMSADMLKRIYEPFFTTKSPDKGTGLGLFTCYRTVLRHNGQIRVESDEGQGTTFEILLPIGRA